MNAIPILETRYSEMRIENVFSKFTKNHAKNHSQSFFFSTGIVDINPMKRISPQVLTILAVVCHIWVLIYSWATNYWLSKKTPMFLQNCRTLNGVVQSYGLHANWMLVKFSHYLGCKFIICTNIDLILKIRMLSCNIITTFERVDLFDLLLMTIEFNQWCTPTKWSPVGRSKKCWKRENGLLWTPLKSQ